MYYEYHTFRPNSTTRNSLDTFLNCRDMNNPKLKAEIAQKKMYWVRITRRGARAMCKGHESGKKKWVQGPLMCARATSFVFIPKY